MIGRARAAQLRDGSVVPQNREALQAQDMAVTGAGPILASTNK